MATKLLVTLTVMRTDVVHRTVSYTVEAVNTEQPIIVMAKRRRVSNSGAFYFFCFSVFFFFFWYRVTDGIDGITWIVRKRLALR